MKRWSLVVLILITACIKNAVQAQPVYSCSDGSVFFRSDAKLELIDASSERLSAVVDIQKKTFLFSIPINSFKGFNAELQREHFLERYMESYKFPQAFFKGKIIEDIQTKEGEQYVRAKGILIIHGVEQERIIKAKLEWSNNAISIKSTFDVPLKDHHIKVPQIVQDKIASEVLVQVNAILKSR
jgi:polyisoprenoid-binding protein YceI